MPDTSRPPAARDQTSIVPEATHEEIDAFLDAHRSELIGLVRNLIAIDSQIPPYGDERAIVTYLRGQTEQLGLGSGQILAADAQRPNLLVHVEGNGNGPTLLMNGHVDTKPIGDAGHLWNHDPFAGEVVENVLYGLGASDMKAAVAAMLYGMYALRQVGVRLSGDVVLGFVADEEAGSTYGSRFLAPKLRGQVDACLIGEPSGVQDDWEGLHLISRGICCFQVRVHGTQLHSSLSDRLPVVNAVLDMAEAMLALRRGLDWGRAPRSSIPAQPTLNVGVTAHGGVFYGVVPGEAAFGCDVRTIPGMTEKTVHDVLERWRASVQSADGRLLDLDLFYEPQLGWIPPSEISANHPLVHAARGAADQVLGHAVPLSVFPGTTDAPWYDMVGIPTIPSFGPGILTYCHGPNEFVSVESIHQAAKIYARTIAGYVGVC